LVVQAALFAGFLSAFLIELLGRLEQDPMDIIQDVLIYQTQMMRNSSLGPYVPPEFSPPGYIVVVNALFYASLGVMLLAAFIAMLIKSWVREFDRGLRALSLPEQRAKTREFRYLGMERWKLQEMVGVLPLLIQISLILFSIGLILFLFQISSPSFGVTTAIFGVGVLYYTITTSISVFVTSSPFHSPLSRAFGMVYRQAHAYFCPSVDIFLSPTMDHRPLTARASLYRRIQIFLQKSRPYLENSFVEPITSTTMDEVQLSTAASALQRIHESVPNSQHSEALHCSVWEVAGSAALRTPPLFNLPSWIIDRGNDEVFISHLPPAMVVALVAVSLRAHRKWEANHISTIRAVLQRADNSKVPWARLVNTIFRRFLNECMALPYYKQQTEANDLITMIQGMELQGEECLWLLNTLSELRSSGWLQGDERFFVGVCLALLLGRAPEWPYGITPDIVLLDAVVTLVAVSCSQDTTYRLGILTRNREYPWLLLNLRSPNLISTFEGPFSNCHKEFISVLFLVVYALIYRDSYSLAVQYFTIITEKNTLPLYTSALADVASSMSYLGLSAIGRMLVAPQTQDLTLIIHESMHDGQRNVQGELFKNYDHQLGASENPDPSIFAILLMLSKHLDSYTVEELQNVDLELKNPWLRLAARVVAQLDIPDGPGLPMGPYHDHRVHNMIAALSLLRYLEVRVTHYTESLLLASFLDSRELAVSSVALEYYMKTMISYSRPLAPSSYLAGAVRAVFNIVLPDHRLQMGWTILGLFVHGFEALSVEWRRTFAEAFFTESRQPLTRPRGGNQTSTPESELEEILTWEYFHEKEHKAAFTDSYFSGLDWMAVAWSLHLSQHPGTRAKGAAQLRDRTVPVVDEEFPLRALSKLLEAAPSSHVIPIIPKLREFVQWFDDTELPEHCRMVPTRVKEAVRRHQMLDKSHKFQCMWNI
jgi:hypothetical protein